MERPSVERPPGKPITVSDIKAMFVARYGEPGKASVRWTKGQHALWAKLNCLGARNTVAIPPETVPNVDATVELSPEEIRALKGEIDTLCPPPPEDEKVSALSCMEIIGLKLAALQQEAKELEMTTEEIPELEKRREEARQKYDQLQQGDDDDATGKMFGLIHTLERKIEATRRGRLERWVKPSIRAVQDLQKLVIAWQQEGQNALPLLQRFVVSSQILPEEPTFSYGPYDKPPRLRSTFMEYLIIVLENADKPNMPEIFGRDLSELRKARAAYMEEDNFTPQGYSAILEVLGNKYEALDEFGRWIFKEDMNDLCYTFYEFIMVKPEALNDLRFNIRLDVARVLDGIKA